MHTCRAVFVGIDTSKLRNAVALAEAGRGGEVRFLGEIDTTDAATRKLVARLAAKYSRLTFCYEAGPISYGRYRLLKSLGHDCIVMAPSLIPKKAATTSRPIGAIAAGRRADTDLGAGRTP